MGTRQILPPNWMALGAEWELLDIEGILAPDWLAFPAGLSTGLSTGWEFAGNAGLLIPWLSSGKSLKGKVG